MIKENIISLDLIPGSMVSETALSTKLELSRTSVREAFDIKSIGDHQAILTAIKNRDKKGGEIAMTKHLTRYKIDDQLLRNQYPRYYKYR